ncbi:hypothetical protein Lser_V15G28894 [Lactuca serriola]
MCSMMANLLPSLATMNNKELVANVIALGVLIITLVVNVCIQINTGAYSYRVYEVPKVVSPSHSPSETGDYVFRAIIIVAVLLMLLVLYACTSLAILKSKQILESKYQSVLKNEDLQPGGRLTVEKLKQYVRKYSIMAETGSPQFMTACSATTTASGVLCALSSVICHLNAHRKPDQNIVDSDYKWSIQAILIIQYIGAWLGAIAPISRCFAALRFKLSVKWIWNHFKVFKVESYWIQKLSDWKHSSIPLFSSRRRKCKILIQNLKSLILCLCIGFQMIVVVASKMIAVIPVFLVICVVYFFHCWKRLKTIFSIVLGHVSVLKHEQLGEDIDLTRYVLQLQDEMEFPDRTLKRISKSVKRLIEKAEKHQPKNLMNLLEKSPGFEGVGKFDSHHVRPLLSEEYLNCWSLTLITLTTIAMSLPNMDKNIVDSLLSGVSEGLVYATLVEESLNNTDDHVIIQRAAKTLWLEVDVYRKWLGNRLQKDAPLAKTTRQILQWLSDKAKNIVTEVESTDIGGRNDNLRYKSICANSMYRITQTILLSYHENIELFAQLSSMIGDILAACLTNLPQVIAMKCHTSVIEKREASVQVAAQLLGKTTQIINILQDRELQFQA